MALKISSKALLLFFIMVWSLLFQLIKLMILLKEEKLLLKRIHFMLNRRDLHVKEPQKEKSFVRINIHCKPSRGHCRYSKSTKKGFL